MGEVQGTGALLFMEGIHKNYPGVQALRGVDFELRSGEVHVLLGENGAGKSTLVKILSGAERMDKGQIYVGGTPIQMDSPIDAIRRGICTVYQEFTLVPQLTAAENIYLGVPPTSNGLVDWTQLKQNARMIIERLGFRLDLDRPVRQLSVAEQQVIEIAKALAREVKVLILDEPTASLAEDEIDRLFGIVRELKGRGVGVIYISHKMEEVAEIGDRATVVRDGRLVGTVNVAETTEADWFRMMVGEEIKEKFPKYEVERGEPVLEIRDFNDAKGRFRNISFELRAGEVLGFAGLVGSGPVDFVRTLLGLHDRKSGEVEVLGKRSRIDSPCDAIDAGIFYLPADRKREGLVLPLSVRDNATLACLKLYSVTGMLSLSRQKVVCQGLKEQLEIKTPSLGTVVRSLSGGNQQKVMIARALASKARVFIFDEPTRGIDVKTKVEIYRLINRLVEQRAGVILISQELPEIIGLCDRILVWRKGEIIKTLARQEASRESLLQLMAGARTLDGDSTGGDPLLV